MYIGTVRFISSFYDYMMLDKDSVLCQWLHQGVITSAIPVKDYYLEHIEVTLQHPDFIAEYEGKQYHLHFKNEYCNGVTPQCKEPTLDNLQVLHNGQRIVVKEY